MTNEDDPTAVRQEAQTLAMHVGAQRSVLAATGQRSEVLDEAAERLTDVLMRAGETEAKALTAAMETLDPTEFSRKRRARLRMAALRGKTSKYGERS
ncbi:hypothetical protein [Nocardioides sp. InS609-2]|uniref:hypothetical protein n=1 Tax=Nocardioides sp. InS609-2 TaxID=2760705 RepID=UPI0020BEFB2C|nr:hypothetical protein [Nocardioides sp. InS609-2]